MVMAKKEDHLRVRMEHITFGKQELERRRKSPVLIKATEIEAQLREHYHIELVAPQFGFTQKTFHFFIQRGTEFQDMGLKLGHRHNIEAVIYVLKGHGYSVVDGKEYPWQAGDFISVPVFAWHMNHSDLGDDFLWLAGTTSPFATAMGTAIFEEEAYPEYWIFAQKGEETMKTLIPGGAEAPSKETMEFEASKWIAESDKNTEPSPAELYSEQLMRAHVDEKQRRSGKVVARGAELRFGSTPMGRVAYAVEPRLGFFSKLLTTLIAEVPAGKHSGAHRHFYEETNYILSGQGYSLIEDQKYEWKQGDVLVIPLFSWHQHFNTGMETARFLVYSTRMAMENTGFVYTQQGEAANY
jgi:gentisate 1,2-dioxygenase